MPTKLTLLLALGVVAALLGWMFRTPLRVWAYGVTGEEDLLPQVKMHSIGDVFVVYRIGDLVATWTDPEGQAVTYTWTVVSGPSDITTGDLIDADQATVSFWAGNYVADEELVLQVSASDGVDRGTHTDRVTRISALESQATLAAAAGRVGEAGR